jgi:hypothetical protein
MQREVKCGILDTASYACGFANGTYSHAVARAPFCCQQAQLLSSALHYGLLMQESHASL